MKGHLIIIEGGDGSGKATQTELLRRRLADDGQSVKAVSYPEATSELMRIRLIPMRRRPFMPLIVLPLMS